MKCVSGCSSPTIVARPFGGVSNGRKTRRREPIAVGKTPHRRPYPRRPNGTAGYGEASAKRHLRHEGRRDWRLSPRGVIGPSAGDGLRRGTGLRGRRSFRVVPPRAPAVGRRGRHVASATAVPDAAGGTRGAGGSRPRWAFAHGASCAVDVRCTNRSAPAVPAAATTRRRGMRQLDVSSCFTVRISRSITAMLPRLPTAPKRGRMPRRRHQWR
jgi:hypothetical protein